MSAPTGLHRVRDLRRGRSRGGSRGKPRSASGHRQPRPSVKVHLPRPRRAGRAAPKGELAPRPGPRPWVASRNTWHPNCPLRSGREGMCLFLLFSGLEDYFFFAPQVVVDTKKKKKKNPARRPKHCEHCVPVMPSTWTGGETWSLRADGSTMTGGNGSPIWCRPRRVPRPRPTRTDSCGQQRRRRRARRPSSRSLRGHDSMRSRWHTLHAAPSQHGGSPPCHEKKTPTCAKINFKKKSSIF
jgi:hypothetical protein